MNRRNYRPLESIRPYASNSDGNFLTVFYENGDEAEFDVTTLWYYEIDPEHHPAGAADHVLADVVQVAEAYDCEVTADFVRANFDGSALPGTLPGERFFRARSSAAQWRFEVKEPSEDRENLHRCEGCGSLFSAILAIECDNCWGGGL